MSGVTWDWPLFEALNFDGPAWLDTVMKLVSGIAPWTPLYLIIIYLVWRRYSWRGTIKFLVAIGVAIALADVVSGIFKQQGLLAELWSGMPSRLRPMYTDGVEAFTNGYGRAATYGTVSGHAATIVAIAVLSSVVIARRWFSVMMTIVAIAVCYSRIYLACHFPQDILLGATLGLVSALVGWWLFRWLQRLQPKG